MTEYTEEEGRTFRTAVFGAMVLVSTAAPGSLDQESHAGNRAMAHLSSGMRDVLKAGRPVLPVGSVSDVEQGVLSALRRSVEILAAKAPAEAEAFPAAVVTICREVAAADGRIAAAEGAMVAKVEAALAR